MKAAIVILSSLMFACGGEIYATSPNGGPADSSPTVTELDAGVEASAVEPSVDDYAERSPPDAGTPDGCIWFSDLYGNYSIVCKN